MVQLSTLVNIPLQRHECFDICFFAEFNIVRKSTSSDIHNFYTIYSSLRKVVKNKISTC